MNQLETLIIPSDTVRFNGQSLEVRGLSLADITYIVRHHQSVVAGLYVKAISGDLSGDVNEIAFAMADDFVPLASMTIACAMGAPKQADIAASLPFSVQVEALEKILSLTLVAEGGLGKLVEIVTRAVQGLKSLPSQEV